jgi:hypothetical protein
MADLLEGWAQCDLTDPAEAARLLGWAGGFRTLIEAVGIDYEPPTEALGVESDLWEC